MLCPKCGRNVGEEIRLCEDCAAQRAQSALGQERSVPKPFGREELFGAGPNTATASLQGVGFCGYAGFWLRFFALLIDSAILFILKQGIVFLLVLFFGSAVPVFIPTLPLSQGIVAGVVTAFIMTVLTTIAALMAIGWLYYALMESSSLQATIGKYVFGLVVTDLGGQRITFLRATGRHFGKILSSITLFIGFLLAGVTSQKQALHDMVAGCLVQKREDLSTARVALSAVFALVFYILVTIMLGGGETRTRRPLKLSPINKSSVGAMDRKEMNDMFKEDKRRAFGWQVKSRIKIDH